MKLSENHQGQAPSNQVSKYPLVVLHLRGSEEIMGRQYGEILQEIGGYEEVLDFYPTMAESLLLQGLPRNMRTTLLNHAIKPLMNVGLNALHRQRPEKFSARTQAALGIVGGRENFAKYINVMDLFQNSLGLVSNIGIIKEKKIYRPRPLPACSATMAWGAATTTGHMLHARNFDFPGFDIWDEAPVVVFCQPDDGINYGYISARGADVPGVSCFNEEGLTITFHTRLHKNVGFDGIGAVDLGHTMIKNARTIDDAIRIASGFKIASTWGIDVSSAKEQRAVIIETNRKKLTVIESKPGDHYLLNTNHYYCSELQNSELATSSAYAYHSRGREARMQQIVDNALASGGISVETLQRMLGDNFDAEANEKPRAMGSTLAQLMGVMSMVVDFEDRAVHVSTGRAPTGWGPYARVEMNFSSSEGYQYINKDQLNFDYEHPYAPSINENKFNAFQHYKKAARLDIEGASTHEVLNQMNKALSLDPDDEAYNYLAGAVNLESGQLKKGLNHFETSLAHEKAGFRRGQTLYLAALTAQALGKTSLARGYASDFKNLNHEYLQYEVASIDKELLSASKARLQKLITSFMLVEAA